MHCHAGVGLQRPCERISRRDAECLPVGAERAEQHKLSERASDEEEAERVARVVEKGQRD